MGARGAGSFWEELVKFRGRRSLYALKRSPGGERWMPRRSKQFFPKKRRLKMDSRRRFALILAITFSLLSLISNTAQTETGRVDANVSAGVSERSGKLALKASSDN